ncbi:MAG: hypothetical protein OXT67_13225 [Zetaproteobacteria bacterium]|nr:hypothetical protein [Zetaproteobacteria bacterium]
MTDKLSSHFEDLIEFMDQSFTWCAKESEEATSQVNEILSMLLDDANRVAAMSKETLDAIGSMQEIISALKPSGDREAANRLAKALLEAAAEDQDVNQFVSPIMEALQFQDRIHQNMNNTVKMMRVWRDVRYKIAVTGKFSNEDRIKFGNTLLECTTMVEERDLIRRHIEGVEPENATQDDVIFF